MILRIPGEDPILETVHILLKFTTPPTSLIGAYLDVESRRNVDKVEHIWYKVTNKVEASLQRGEAVILIGDLNPPLQIDRKSKRTKMLLEWLKLNKMTLLNKPGIYTRFDPKMEKRIYFGSLLGLKVD